MTTARCAHCGHAQRPWLWKVAALVGGSAAAVTLMACYGTPCAGDDACWEPPPDQGVVTDLSTPPDMTPIADGGTTD